LYALEDEIGVFNDLRAGSTSLSFQLRAKRHMQAGHTVVDIWYETLAKHGPKPALMFGGTTHTFAQLESLSNRVAHWGASIGLQAGQTVALLAHNSDRFIILWLGLCKIGVPCAFQNTGLKIHQLNHSLAVARPAAIIFDSSFDADIKAALAMKPSPATAVAVAAAEAHEAATIAAVAASASTPLGKQLPTSQRPDRRIQLISIDDGLRVRAVAWAPQPEPQIGGGAVNLPLHFTAPAADITLFSDTPVDPGLRRGRTMVRSSSVLPNCRIDVD
jgi:acyl-CoA synthetase (AMP-forming)/AMP-acid ligase II